MLGHEMTHPIEEEDIIPSAEETEEMLELYGNFLQEAM